MIETKIIKIKGDWNEVLNDCRSTVGKEYLNKEPSEKFKKKILIAEHSPIRDIIIKWMWDKIPSWVATHWVRHKWECFVKSQRTDRTGVDRDVLRQDVPVTFTGEANIQNLIDTMRKRLCRQAAYQTRKYAESLKKRIYKDYDKNISNVLVPNCVYRGGCPELENCKFFKTLIEYTNGEILTTDIQHRYDLYNEYFYKEINKDE